MRKSIHVAFVVIGIISLLSLSMGSVLAASTTKNLSTNFTLVNLGSAAAGVAVQYVKEDGTAWDADNANESFTIPGNGGQKIIRQYQDATLAAGKGSVVVSSDQPLGAVVQILARNQVPTSGAYSGFTVGSDTFYIPLLARRGSTSTGTANSQIIVQNAGTAATDVSIALTPFAGSTGTFTKPITGLLPGASFYYDLETEAGLATTPWFGSAVVTATSAGGQIVVVSNFFTGADAMQTYNAFPKEKVGTKWLVPLLTSRLGNGLSTPVTVQALSAAIPAGGVSMTCTKDVASPAPATLSMTNSTPIAQNASYAFNPVSDAANFPTGWFGSCLIDSGSVNTVAFVQMRYVGVTNQGAAAYEAIPASGTDKTVFVPLVAKRLSNGFATAVTIQNLSTTQAASVTLVYTPEAGGTPITVGPLSIPPGGSLIRNQRTLEDTAIPENWVGTLKVTSTTTPISAFVQLTYITNTGGDSFQAHVAFTQP